MTISDWARDCVWGAFYFLFDLTPHHTAAATESRVSGRQGGGREGERDGGGCLGLPLDALVLLVLVAPGRRAITWVRGLGE